MQKSTAILLFAFGMVAQPPALVASLLCTAGNVIGIGSCNETSTLAYSGPELNHSILTLDQWTAHAAAGFTQTLTQAKFTFSGGSSASGPLTNSGAVTESFTFERRGELDFSAAAGDPGNFLPSTVSISASTGPQAFTLAPSAYTAYSDSLTLGPSADSIYTTNLAQYVGPGSFTVLVSSHTANVFIGGGGFIDGAHNTLYSPTVQAQYLFNTVAAGGGTPEPATSVMLLGGLAGGFLWARRRKYVGALRVGMGGPPIQDLR